MHILPQHLLIEGHRRPVQVHAAVFIDLEFVLRRPPSAEFVVGRHRATEVVMAVWRQRLKIDGEILMIVDGTCEDETSGDGFGRWKGPCATVGGNW